MAHLNYLDKQVMLKNFRIHLLSQINPFIIIQIHHAFLQPHQPQIGINFFLCFESQIILFNYFVSSGLHN